MLHSPAGDVPAPASGAIEPDAIGLVDGGTLLGLLADAGAAGCLARRQDMRLSPSGR